MTNPPENDNNEKRGLMEFFYWGLCVAVFLFADLGVNVLTTHGIIS